MVKKNLLFISLFSLVWGFVNYSMDFSLKLNHQQEGHFNQTEASREVEHNIRRVQASPENCKLLEGHTDGVNFAAFNKNGTKVVSASNDCTVILWDVTSGKAEHVFKGHTKEVNSAVFNEVGDKIVSASDDGTIRIWDIARGECERVLVGHRYWVKSAAFNKTGTKIVSASDDQTVRIWDVRSGQCERVFNTDLPTSASFNQAGDQIVVALWAKSAQIWNVESGKCEHIFEGHNNCVNSAVFNKGGGRIVSASNDQTARIWNVASGECEHILLGHTVGVRSAAFNDAGDKVVSGSWDYDVRIWDVEKGACEVILSGHEKVVNSAKFNRSGTMVVSTSDDHMIRIWNLNNVLPMRQPLENRSSTLDQPLRSVHHEVVPHDNDNQPTTSTQPNGPIKLSSPSNLQVPPVVQQRVNVSNHTNLQPVLHRRNWPKISIRNYIYKAAAVILPVAVLTGCLVWRFIKSRLF